MLLERLDHLLCCHQDPDLDKHYEHQWSVGGGLATGVPPTMTPYHGHTICIHLWCHVCC